MEGSLGIVKMVRVVESSGDHDKFVSLSDMVAEMGLGLLGVRAVRLF